MDESLPQQFPGVHSARRFRQDRSPINRIVIVYGHPELIMPNFKFDLLPHLSLFEVRTLHDDRLGVRCAVVLATYPGTCLPCSSVHSLCLLINPGSVVVGLSPCLLLL